jgi:hypothetical protein
MIMKKLAIILIFLLISLTIPTIFVRAQTGSFFSPSLTIELDPLNPAPGNKVTATVRNLPMEFSGGQVAWSLNGKKQLAGSNILSFPFIASGYGQTMTLTVDLTSLDGQATTQKTLSFIPAGVDLIYEAVSYTPPFYKGKAFNSNQGTVVVVALPEIFTANGQKVKATNLNYRWYKDGVLQNSASGLGQSYLTFSGSVPIRDAEIKVIVSTVDKKITAEKSLIITHTSPQLIFYENSPVYGLMFNKAIKETVKLLADEFEVKAFPYFMSVDYANDSNLQYQWMVNGRLTDNLEKDSSAMVFRQERAGAGTADVSVKIQNTLRIFQSVDNNFILNFEKQ